MLEQYKKTFVGMQVVILSVTAAILVWRHLWGLAALFFVTMQVAALLGALWGNRLKGKFQRGSGQATAR